MKPNSIVCPKCQTPISVDQALSYQIEKELRNKFEEDMHKWEREQKEVMWKKAQEAAQQKVKDQLEAETRLLKEESDKQKKELWQARENELRLRQERNKLEDEKKNYELLKQRELDSERSKIKKLAEEQFLEKNRLKEAEKEKQIADMRKTIEELQLKANQSSQQRQGEVMELEIESVLKSEFPLDEISPVGKGINGADVIQVVRDGSGRVCGKIVWESKRTKNWDKDWITKLKEDTLKSKGDIALLVSIALPDEIKNFGFKEGIYVTSFECFLSVAFLLRKTLLEQQRIKTSEVGKNEKMAMVYNYFLSNEFRQRVETIAEAFASMKQDLEVEKKVFAKLWAKREKEIERVVHNTVTMHGDLQGLMGNELPVIENLEPEALIESLTKTSQNVLFDDEV